MNSALHIQHTRLIWEAQSGIWFDMERAGSPVVLYGVRRTVLLFDRYPIAQTGRAMSCAAYVGAAQYPYYTGA